MTESDKVVPVVNLPNALTLLRLVMVPLFAWMLLAHPHDITWRWATTAVFIIALLTDLADGAIARKKNLITNFGKLWDPIADKAITGMAMIGLSILGELWWWVTIVILIREWGITIMRFLIVKYGVQAADKLGKMKTLTQTIALIGLLAPFIFYMEQLVSGPWYLVCFLLHWIAIIAMGIALILTVVSGVNYVLGAIALRKQWLAEQDSTPPKTLVDDPEVTGSTTVE
ncbi:MAG: CDP-diacylglycerol--glycerol-3-phosphate 3-phosphatidyltransferase [Propionibacteriaceae bacterium]|jgi:CDP-diacylglycerol--glycerol-3-phosphate 3-phosphatidyltransferase|nr:CDP-diacylglycerol--glycerol-3-phosphate 3-phosphatidyltransferase [Propionibacteriaceae bacterium]